VIEPLLRPLRQASTWRSLVHVVLDLPVGIAAFVPAVVLLFVSGSLIATPLLPLGIIGIWVLLLFAGVVASVERSRLSALHGVDLVDPVPPIEPGSFWSRLRQWLLSGPRWKAVGYCLLRLPAAVAFVAAASFVWSGSLALATLPLTIGTFPADVARFGLFDVTFGPTAFLLALTGSAGLLLVAPWTTVLLGRVDVALARWLLGPDVGVELEARVSEAERSRAAAVGAAEAERRRIERDLHDGAQQRLVALAMDLGAAREQLETDPEAGRLLVAEAHEEAKAALREIRDLVRGIHPVILEDRGLDAALSAVVARSPVPVELDVTVDRRLPPAVESTAYFVVSEALTNIARHAGATRARVAIALGSTSLIVEVRDDGRGGADPALGTGLAGLRDRVVGMGGTLDLLSPAGGPTTLLVELPCAS
jgi:signal transduction histidine kinase